MIFFDCHASYGFAKEGLFPGAVHTREDLLEEMDQAGVRHAVVSRIEQLTTSPQLGNKLLADDLAGQDRLYGLWAIVPVHTAELPEPAQMLAEMKQSRIVGWQLCPGDLRFLPKAFVLTEWLELAQRNRVPLFVNTAHGCGLDDLADLLEKFPQLVVVLSDTSVWPGDRLLRPFLAAFPHVYLDLTNQFTAGGLASLVKQYGAGRLLYGSGFPQSYLGANMLLVRHAAISEADKAAIASGNLMRLIGEINYDQP